MDELPTYELPKGLELVGIDWSAESTANPLEDIHQMLAITNYYGYQFDRIFVNRETLAFAEIVCDKRLLRRWRRYRKRRGEQWTREWLYRRCERRFRVLRCMKDETRERQTQSGESRCAVG